MDIQTDFYFNPGLEKYDLTGVSPDRFWGVARGTPPPALSPELLAAFGFQVRWRQGVLGLPGSEGPFNGGAKPRDMKQGYLQKGPSKMLVINEFSFTYTYIYINIYI